MPPSSPLGDYIRRQRELYGMSMRQFAELAGISNPYLSQIERGLREPSDKVVDAIARSLETTADALYEQAGVSFDEDDASANGVLAAIDADPGLTPRQRRAMRDVYEAFLAANGAAPRRRRRPRAGGAGS
jgi:transcriptional regulator with XRE-family HTH domain